MKKYFPIFLTLFFGIKLFAGETNNPPLLKIGTSQAEQYYDKMMIVTGRVAQVKILPKVVLLDLDKKYPNSPFTLVIFNNSTNEFGNLNSLEGRNIEATGKIKNYHDRPEIILTSTNQLKIDTN